MTPLQILLGLTLTIAGWAAIVFGLPSDNQWPRKERNWVLTLLLGLFLISAGAQLLGIVMILAGVMENPTSLNFLDFLAFRWPAGQLPLVILILLLNRRLAISVIIGILFAGQLLMSTGLFIHATANI